MKCGIPAFLTPKTHIFAICYFTPPVHSGSMGEVPVAIEVDLEHVW